MHIGLGGLIILMFLGAALLNFPRTTFALAGLSIVLMTISYNINVHENAERLKTEEAKKQAEYTTTLPRCSQYDNSSTPLTDKYLGRACR